jgi:hypothetical protein
MSLFETVKTNANELHIDQINSLIRHLSETKKQISSAPYQRKAAMKQIKEAFISGYHF